MNKSQVIFEKENYKLVLSVFDHVNDYRQHVFIANLKLYTSDNILIISDHYSFNTLSSKVKNNIDLCFDYYLDHLQSRFLPSTLAYDLYLKAFREGSTIAKNI